MKGRNAQEGGVSTEIHYFVRIRFWGSILVLALVILTMGIKIIHVVDGYLPYPRHMDEAYITERADKILKTNDWNPHLFNYSSFPVYLTTAAFSGFLGVAGSTGARVNVKDDVKCVSYPYYNPAAVVAPARYLYAFFVLIALVAAGILGYWLLGAPEMMPLAPFLGYFSVFLKYQSLTYINVDVLAVCIITLTLVAVINAQHSASFAASALVPGLFCGLAVAAKYTCCWILAPALLGIWLFKGDRKIGRSAVLIFCAALAFLAVVPWAILDIRTFLNELGGQARVYAMGRSGRTYEPGWNHASQYITAIIRDFGVFAAPLALLGAIYGIRKNLRHMIILAAFPALNLLHLSTSSLFYERNAIFIYVFYVLLISAGFIALYWILEALSTRIPVLKVKPRLRMPAVWLALILLGCGAFSANSHLCFAKYNPDTRNRATAWIKENIPAGARIVAPDELGLDVGQLEPDYSVLLRDYNTFTPESFAAQSGQLGAFYALMPEWGAYKVEDKAKAANKNALNEIGFPLMKYAGKQVGAYMLYPVYHGDPAFSLTLNVPGSSKLDANAVGKMGILDKYNIAETGNSLKSLLPADFREALNRDFSPKAVKRQPISPELDFVDKSIARVDEITFDCRFLFFVNKPIEKDWRFFFHGQVAEQYVDKIPEDCRKNRTQMWNFSPPTPTSQWPPNQFIVLSTKISAADIPYQLRCGFFLSDGGHLGGALPLGEVDFSKL